MATENILVAVRMRPPIARETGQKSYWKAEPPTTICHTETSLNYSYDRVFDDQVENGAIYNEICSDIVKSVIGGFNGTIFAYGQTSSGKTFTMLGDTTGNVKGIIHYAIEEIFSLIQQMNEREFLLRVSYMEIYNETVRDLLTGEDNLNLKDEHGQIKVAGLQEKLVQKPEQILEFMKKGERRRRIGDTKMNEKSSRSHAIFRMIIESCEHGVDDAAVNVSQFNLVDLAGSEKPESCATGTRFKESIKINLSLSTLGKVINQLSESDSQFINYRDSKLTRILQNSLGGNSLTAIICTVTAACSEETQSTLKFAERAKQIKNKPQRNEVLTEQALLKQYANKIKKLTAELEATKEEKSQQNKHLQEKIKYLKKQYIFQPAVKVKNIRRETWGGTLDAARFRELIPPPNSFGGRQSFSRGGSCNLSILEEQCEDSDGDELFNPLQSTQKLKLPKRSSNSKRISNLLKTADAAVQAEPEGLGLSPKFSEVEREELTKEISILKKELAELQEFTTLEKQMKSESCNSCSNVCKRENIISTNDEGFHGLSESFAPTFDPSVFEEIEVKKNDSIFSSVEPYKLKSSEKEEDLFQYLESTMKIMSTRKHIDFPPVASDLNNNYKITLEMFNLILQYQCLTFKECFKSEICKKVDEVLCSLRDVFKSFSDQTSSNEIIEDLVENFISKTDCLLREIEMCSLDSDADCKNDINNQSRPFDSISDLPSFEESPRVLMNKYVMESRSFAENVNLSSTLNRDRNSVGKATGSACDCEKLKSKIVALEKDIEEHLNSISAADSTNLELNEKIAVLQKQIDLYQTSVSNDNGSSLITFKDQACQSTSDNDNSLITFKDQACQYAFMEGISLSSGFNVSNVSDGDVNNLGNNLCNNYNRPFDENKISMNEQCSEEALPYLPISHSEKENWVNELKTNFEATLGDLTELKLYTLDFMKREMKKEYLVDIGPFDEPGNYPLPDQIKVEVTALKELLLRLEFYLNARSDVEKHMTDSLEDKLLEIFNLEDKLTKAESTIKTKEEEYSKLECALLSIENNVSEMVQKLKSLGSVKDRIHYFELEDDTSHILHLNKSLNCAVNIEKLVSEMHTLIDKTVLSMNDLSLSMKCLKETKSVQTVKDNSQLNLSEELKEMEALNENLHIEIKRLKSELEILTEAKDNLQEELDEKISLYDNKIKAMEMKFGSEKENYATKRVKETEEKYYRMIMEQENKFLEEKHQIELDSLKQINDYRQNYVARIDQLQEENHKNLSDLKKKLSTEIDERHKERMKLDDKIRTREKDMAQYQNYNAYLKSKCKELAVELKKLKEKAKSFELKENVSQEKTSEKVFHCKETQTSGNHLVSKSSPDLCSRCKEFKQTITEMEAFHQNEIRKSELLYTKLQNECEAKKAKIISLESNNAKMVKEIVTLKKEISSKSVLLRFCQCRGLTNKAATAPNLENNEKVIYNVFYKCDFLIDI